MPMYNSNCVFCKFVVKLEQKSEFKLDLFRVLFNERQQTHEYTVAGLSKAVAKPF